MYVRELIPGVMIRPAKDHEWALSAINRWTASKDTPFHQGGAGANELIDNGIQHHSSLRFRHPSRGVTQRDIGVYLGVKVLDGYYFGVKKQHMVLVDGILCVVDGYQFKHVEKV